MVLLPSHGNLIDEIVRDGYRVCDRIIMSLEGHNHYSMAKSLGVFLSSFVETLHREQPDWVVLAGDRGEQLMGAIAAAYTYRPVAHIQAGERSGNIDGVARHAIGKFVHLHFAANQDAADRLVRLGEDPFRVHLVGAPQLDELRSSLLPDRAGLSAEIGLDEDDYLLVVLHPVTEEYDSATEHTLQIIEALNRFELNKVWVLPNNDAGAGSVRRTILENRNTDTLIYDNLSRLNYLSLLKHASAIVGNSSSGILEAPTFGTPTVNIGRRQADRVQGKNVINAHNDIKSIEAAIQMAVDPVFRESIKNTENPYGDGRSSNRILDILSRTKIDDRLLVKRLTY